MSLNSHVVDRGLSHGPGGLNSRQARVHLCPRFREENGEVIVAWPSPRGGDFSLSVSLCLSDEHTRLIAKTSQKIKKKPLLCDLWEGVLVHIGPAVLSPCHCLDLSLIHLSFFRFTRFTIEHVIMHIDTTERDHSLQSCYAVTFLPASRSSGSWSCMHAPSMFLTPLENPNSWSATWLIAGQFSFLLTGAQDGP